MCTSQQKKLIVGPPPIIEEDSMSVLYIANTQLKWNLYKRDKTAEKKKHERKFKPTKQNKLVHPSDLLSSEPNWWKY